MVKKFFLALYFISHCVFLQSQSLKVLTKDPVEDHVWVVAHRGDFSFAPENSLPALENAIFFGADIVETDVRLTKDGRIVIMHDETVDRTTTGSGRVSELTLADLKRLRLKKSDGGRTSYTIPTLEELIHASDGRVYLYFDKVGIDLNGHQEGYLVRKVLNILRKEGALEKSVFVLNWSYSKAKAIFGEDLTRVIFIPVIEDTIPDLKCYVDDYIKNLSPVAFQFRFQTTDSKAFQLLPYVLAAGSKAFIAATWDHHTANHSDRTSIFSHPDNGWGWLLQHGFRIIETNCTRELVNYLKSYPDNSRTLQTQ